jgi:hypothetical protein
VCARQEEDAWRVDVMPISPLCPASSTLQKLGTTPTIQEMLLSG